MARLRKLALLGRLFLILGLIWSGSSTTEALEQTNHQVPETAVLEQKVGTVKMRGSAHLASDVQRLRGSLQLDHLFKTPLFLVGEARFHQENHSPYDLRHWGGEVGLGWAFTEQTSVTGTYRLDHYRVFHTGESVDPAFYSVAGHHTVTALGVVLQHDSRDDHYYPTSGTRFLLGPELALKGLGGDYNFGRIDSEVAWYATPWHGRANSKWIGDVTFVEHALVGRLGNFGKEDDVPFFERYYVGGTNTVRGHRSRWITPRGRDDQFVGGDVQIVNNLEARLPLLPEALHRRLSLAAFVDAGRASRRVSEIGDFEYGLGAGLRYVVHLWKLQGVARVDWAFNISHEDDDAHARFHATFGLPF